MSTRRLARGLGALLVVLVLAIAPRGNMPTPPSRDSSTRSLGSWWLWYESEAFEDCGTEAMLADPMPCVDVYQRASGPFATYSQCNDASGKYAIRSEDTFECAQNRPPAENDDACRPVDAGEPGCPDAGGSK